MSTVNSVSILLSSNSSAVPSAPIETGASSLNALCSLRACAIVGDVKVHVVTGRTDQSARVLRSENLALKNG